MAQGTSDRIFKVLAYLFYAAIALVAVVLIASAVPVPGGIKTYVVQSGSMEPAIKTGSVVVIKPMADYRVGDVITFGPKSKGKTPTTHRIMEVKEGGFVTRGDANNGEDMRTVSRYEIIGKVLFSVPYIGYAVATAQQPWGFGLIIVIPAVLIIYEEAQKIRRELKKKADYKRRVEKRPAPSNSTEGAPAKQDSTGEES